MKTVTRSSTLQSTLILMIVGIIPALAFAAGAPTPAPTQAGEFDSGAGSPRASFGHLRTLPANRPVGRPRQFERKA